MKRFTSALLAVFTVIALICVPVSAGGTQPSEPLVADTSWYNGVTGSEYYISTAEQFLGLATVAANGEKFDGKTIYITADIDLNPGWDATVSVDGDNKVTMPSVPDNVFDGISEFKGTLDGQGHTVSGLYMKNENLSWHWGFISRATGNVVIKNLVMSNGIVCGIAPTSIGNHGFGALIGSIDDANGSTKIENVYVDVNNVFQTSNAANGMVSGFVGRLSNTSAPTVANSAVTEYKTYIKNSVYAGDLITMDANETISANVLNISPMCGGGKQETVSGLSTPYMLVENCVAMGEIYSGKANNYGEGKLTFVNLIEKALTKKTEVVEADVKAKDGSTPYASYNEPLAAEFTYSAFAKAVIPRSVMLLKADISWYDASVDDYYISNAKEFRGLAEVALSTDFAGKTIYITEDIDLNPGWTNTTSVDGSKNVAMTAAPANVFGGIPQFAGTLDGCGHTVSGIYIYNDMTAGGSIQPVGFINYITGLATIKNLVFADSIHYAKREGQTGWSTGIGGLIGTIKNDQCGVTVENVYLDMDVVYESTSTDNLGMIGGIIGRVESAKIPDYPASLSSDDPRVLDENWKNPDLTKSAVSKYYTVIDSVVYAGNVITMKNDGTATLQVLNASQMVGGAGNFSLQIKNSADETQLLRNHLCPIVRLENVVTLGGIHSVNTESYGEKNRLYLVNLIEGAKSEGSITETDVRGQTGNTEGYAFYYGDRADEFTYSAEVGAMVPSKVAIMLATPFEASQTKIQVTAGTTSESESTALRFVSSFAGAYAAYSEIGYVISVSNDSPVFGGTNVTALPTNVLYESVQSGAAPETAPEGSLWLVMGVDDIPQASFSTNIYIRAYAKTADGFTVYGDVYAVSVSDALAALNSAA